NLVGIELLEDRARAARERLPQATAVIHGDASSVEVPGAPFDVVLQATVFTSILDGGFQQSLAARMWELAQPGGGILWYDFAVSNPSNPDVRGVPLARVRELFPRGRVAWHRRVTLAPPLGRPAARIHRSLYSLLRAVPLLRTHELCWIAK